MPETDTNKMCINLGMLGICLFVECRFFYRTKAFKNFIMPDLGPKLFAKGHQQITVAGKKLTLCIREIPKLLLLQKV